MALITAFDPWKSGLCTCPAKYSLSAYTGCSHGCLYCYASSYIRNFSSVRPKKDFIKRLEKEIKKIPHNSIITIANSSDPYLPLEKELELTRTMLNILKDHPVKLLIVTRSDLILRDIDILKKLKVAISFTMTTLDKNLSKKLEPNAPLPEKRLKAINELSKYLPVMVRFDPLIYPINTDEIEDMVKAVKANGARQIITSTYKAKPDNFKRMIGSFKEHRSLWEKLYKSQGEKRGRYTYLPKNLRRSLIKKVKTACLDFGLEFTSCREGFEKLNTLACDGSSFL